MRSFLSVFALAAAICAWGACTPQESTSDKAPAAPEPQPASQANASRQEQSGGESQEDQNKKEGGRRRRFGNGCLHGMKCWGSDQDRKDPDQGQPAGGLTDQAPPRTQSDDKAAPRGPGDSSSRDTNPGAVSEAPDDSVTELHSWDPHKAQKDIEVGDFYFKRENYHAALSRYCEALEYKPNDAVATFRIAEALDKSGDLAGARSYYQQYLKILPNGPFAAQTKKALDRIKAQPGQPDKRLAREQGCEPPGKAAKFTPEPLDPHRPVLTRNPTSPASGKSQ
jgi:tetratricopeptide (TPR) repeat protein